MRIVCDTDTVLKELEAYHKDTIRRSKNMLSQFAYKVTWAASENTPVGDAERIALGPDTSYYEFYKDRNEQWQIPIEPGFHSGAWKFSRTNTFQLDPSIYTQEQAAGQVMQDVKAEYAPNRRIFYIGAIGPGYKELDNGSSPQSYPDGIMKPTLKLIETVYSLELSKYYKAN